MNNNSPGHVAIIMDGNGRWAESKEISRSSAIGHEKGIEAAQEIIDTCLELEIKYLTLYAFSEDNWNRDKQEVTNIMSLFARYINKDHIEKLKKRGIKINIIGKIHQLPQDIIDNITKYIIEDNYFNPANIKMTLTIALNYSARGEIINAIKKIKELNIKIDDINSELVNSMLYTKDIPYPDLLIRTGKEKRISNFLLWQIAYTELYFSDTMWPNFTKEDLVEAINEYRKRNRRYGKN